MIRLSPFEVLCPTSLGEATEMLGRGGETQILAGGTDLVVKMKHTLCSAKRLVWMGKLEELRGIAFFPAEGLRVGAMCTLSELASSPDVVSHYPALAQALRSVASPAIRNRATIGGNLCVETRCLYYDQSEFWREALGGCLKWKLGGGDGEEVCHAAPGLSKCSAVLCSDLAPALIALGASVRLVSANEERRIPLSQLYQDDGVHFLRLRSGEFISEVLVPTSPSGRRSVFKKMRWRNSIDFPIVNVAASVTMEDRICFEPRIIIGAIRSAPVQVERAEEILTGRELTREGIQHAAEEAASFLHPLATIGPSVVYRKRMIRVLVEQALGELAEVAY